MVERIVIKEDNLYWEMNQIMQELQKFSKILSIIGPQYCPHDCLKLHLMGKEIV